MLDTNICIYIIKNKPLNVRKRFDGSLAKDFTLITNNMKEFKRIKGLKVENWI